MQSRNGSSLAAAAGHAASSKYVMAFLQARMGSLRLPGKVLMPIQGRSILERAVDRLRASASVDEVAVLTTRLPEDDIVAESASALGAVVYRGPELDVLARFYQASREFNPDIIVRATADNPLIEIVSIDRIVRTLLAENSDLCMEHGLPYGAATEALTAESLWEAHFRAKEAHHREHVTLYIKDHPESFRISYPDPPHSVRYPQIRLTVDTLEDFRFVDHLIRLLPESETPLPLEDYLPLALNMLHAGEGNEFAHF